MTAHVWNTIAALCQIFSGLYAMWALYKIPHLLKQLDDKERTLKAQRLAHDEMQSLVGTLCRLATETHLTESTNFRLNQVLVGLSQALPDYSRDLTRILSSKPVFPPYGGEPEAPYYYLPSNLRPGGTLDQLVSELNDPTMTLFWEIRTPSALCEMLAHGLSLATGKPVPLFGSPAPEFEKVKNTRTLWKLWQAYFVQG